MELHEADLEAFSNDAQLAGLAEQTVKGYVDQLRRLHRGRTKGLRPRSSTRVIEPRTPARRGCHQ